MKHQIMTVMLDAFREINDSVFAETWGECINN